MKEKNKREEGITLVVLVVTIIVLLILAGVSLSMVFSQDGIFSRAELSALEHRAGTVEDEVTVWKNEKQIAKYEQSTVASRDELIESQKAKGLLTEEEAETAKTIGKVKIGTKTIDYTIEWTQDKTIVTDGTVTLEVGQAVTGYTANGVGDENWCVLGAKDGRLLITTNSNQGTVTLEGQDGYVNGVSKLNTEGGKFKDTTMAEIARSIDIEDINRVTGYNPDVANYNSGNDFINQWKNEATYTLNSDGKIHYKGTKYPTTDTVSSYTSFTYWNGSSWETLKNETGKNSITLTQNFYYYYPQTLSTTSSSETTINGSSKAYDLLFASTSDDYWISSQYVDMHGGYCYFGLWFGGGARMYGLDLYYSNSGSDSESFGIRPVVSLKPNIKITKEGVLSI